MPELPDVETWRRYIDATSLHQVIENLEVEAPRMLRGISATELRANLTGRAFETTARHGKFLFIRVDQGPWLLLHFGMTGALKYFKDIGEAPAHTRLLVHFASGYNLAGIWQRRLGRIGLAESPADFVRREGLGPDAFDPGVGLDEFRRLLRNRRGGVKSALMDQGLIAGIGNVYSDEILFQAGIQPEAKAADLDPDRATSLHRALRHVLRIAIERQADPERLPDSWLLPHRQENARCPRCGATLRQAQVAGRTAYFCPECQRH